MPPLHTQFIGRKDGFALIVAITLMAFILLLLTSLVMIVGVETRNAGMNIAQEKARQNALFGLQVAIGQLQKLTGPDQRVTATASILDTNPDTAALEGVAKGKQHWTGVWWNPAAAPANVTGDHAWLVSGSNHDLQQALPTDYQQSFAPMVSRSEAIEENQQSTDPETVVAPKVDFGPNNAYAYWISDENTKAKLSVDYDAATETDNNGFLNAAEFRKSRLTVGNRFAVENMTEEPDLFSESPETVAKLQELGYSTDVVLTDFVSSGLARERFHDWTVDSSGLLVDVRDGSLKKDLTTLFSDEPANWPSEYRDQPIADYPSGANYESAPTWNYMDSYFDLRNEAKDTSLRGPERLFDVRPYSTDQHPLSPIVTVFGMGLAAGLSESEMPRAHFHPIAMLYNPYNVKLAAKDDYVLGFASARNEPKLEIKLKKSDGSETHGGNLFTGKMRFTSSGYPDRAPRFRLNVPEMEPGEMIIFALDAEEAEFNLDADGNPLNIMTPSNLATQHSVYVDSPDDQLGKSSRSGYYLKLFPTTNSNGRDHTNLILTDLNGNDFQKILGVHLYQRSGERTTEVNRVDEPIREIEIGWLWHLIGSVEETGDYLYHGDNITFSRYANFNPRAPKAQPAAADYNLGRYVWKSSIYEDNPIWDIKNTGQLSNGIHTPGDWPWLNYSTEPSASASARSVYHGGVETQTEFRGDYQGEQLYVPLFDVPDAGNGIFSLGQFQHMMVSRYIHSPSYAIGNSLASPYLPRTATYLATTQSGSLIDNSTDEARDNYGIVDTSWHLNDSLWDTYFFSITENWNSLSEPLPNSRYYLANDNPPSSVDDLKDINRAAEFLRVDGSFNINSTSVEAWKAVFGTLNGLQFDPTDYSATNQALENPFFRISYQPDQAIMHDKDGNPVNGAATLWDGFHQLSSDNVEADGSITAGEITRIAEAMVREVKLRGPFLSMSDFVNRALVDDETGLKGALQAAIDSTSKNADPGGIEIESVATGDEGQYYEENIATNTNDGIPGYLSQADILTAIGPWITNRGDTFRIRAYGEYKNELTDEVISQALCEVILERTVGYVGDEDAITAAADLDSNSVSSTLGRQYRIKSFRWIDG